MELFGRLETIPGIHSDERFPLVAPFFVPLRRELSRSVPNPPYHSHLTFDRPQRHFLAISRRIPINASSRLGRNYEGRWWHPDQRTRQIKRPPASARWSAVHAQRGEW
jgi:hypothetical protein